MISQEQLLEDRLRAQNFAMKQLVVAASHDLISPGRAIVGLAERLRGELPAQKRCRFVDLIQNAGERTVKQSNALLELAGRALEEPVPILIDIDALLKHSIEALAPDSEPIAEIVIQNELGYAFGHEADLAFIFHSLILNAIEHGQRTPRLTIEATGSSDALQLRFENDGREIETAYRQRIFDIFERLDARDDVRGRGLGLTLSRFLAYRLGGRLECIEPDRAGACFSLTLRR